nr:immunoglobulin light chain junction region [Macaca mulatta]MPN91079.1 immunoglobulin light chain junction region [Macaca mulatta]MPN91337.1 immunoglobulin light chain junction region [Macaca mulatta]MPN92595.1 immunoglobulin light chain junction region [Macaca mulatta]MPN93431.1 immunoglobulin light chain junction region [Macaca mulatta]
CMQALQTPFTC